MADEKYIEKAAEAGCEGECDSPKTIRLAGVVRESIVDGPGIRFVVFCQGCIHDCPGCQNPDTHDFNGGYDCDIQKILEAVDQNKLLDGITFSGGEPFCQAGRFIPLAKEIRKREGLDILIFTGFTYEQLEDMGKSDPDVKELMDMADTLVDGRFVLEERDLSLRFRGSRNQRIIDMNATRKEGHVVLAEEYMS